MKNLKKNAITRRKGITLISLVVTIIVLLILAGISIAMLTGNNGILQRATDAKTYTDNSQIQERINLAYHSSLVDGQGKVTEPLLESELKKEFNKTVLDDGWLDKTSIRGKWKISIDGISLEIPAGTDETELSNDESTKLYNSLKDKTVQEIMNGITIDGVEVKYIAPSGNTGAIIEYNNQSYTVSLNPTDYSVLAIRIFGGNGKIVFYVQGNMYEADEGMTFGQWIEKYSPSDWQIRTIDDQSYVECSRWVFLQEPNSNDFCTKDSVIVKNHDYYTSYERIRNFVNKF